MEKFEQASIERNFLLGFIVSPLAWIAMGVYIGLYTIKGILNMNPLLPILYFLFIIAIYFYTSKLLGDIDVAIKKPDRKNTYKAQKAIVFMPKLYLIILPVYSLILPISAQTDFAAFTTFELFLEIIFSFFMIFLTATPFFILMLSALEREVLLIPVSSIVTDLNIDTKFSLISLPNILGTFFITISTYLLIFLKSELSPDLVYQLLNKGLILGIFLISIFTFNQFMLRNQILEPIKQINDFMVDIVLSGGNVNKRLNINNRDEFNSIATNFNRLMDFLRQSLAQIDFTTEDMVNASKRLSQNTKKHGYSAQRENEVLNEVEKNSNQVKNITDEVQIQSQKNKTEVSSILGNINIYNNRNSKHVENLSQFTEDIRETANAAKVGERSLGDMRHTMEMLYNLFQDITEVMGFSQDVAEKINLISLNASIEAARAGEMGSGFAVVAEQIARLAEETRKNLNQIEVLLEKSNEKMGVGTEQILNGVNTILGLLGGVEDIERSFGKIVFTLSENVKSYASLEQEIEVAEDTALNLETKTHSQREKISLLFESIERIEQFNKLTLENLKELSNTVEHNQHFANDLQKKITRFQIIKADSSAQ